MRSCQGCVLICWGRDSREAAKSRRGRGLFSHQGTKARRGRGHCRKKAQNSQKRRGVFDRKIRDRKMGPWPGVVSRIFLSPIFLSTPRPSKPGIGRMKHPELRQKYFWQKNGTRAGPFPLDVSVTYFSVITAIRRCRPGFDWVGPGLARGGDRAVETLGGAGGDGIDELLHAQMVGSEEQASP